MRAHDPLRLNTASKVLVAQEDYAQAAINTIPDGVLPAAFEVGTLAEVKDEIFGPVWQIDPVASVASAASFRVARHAGFVLYRSHWYQWQVLSIAALHSWRKGKSE